MSHQCYLTNFEKDFLRLSRKYGGWENYHAHPDRAFVLGAKYFVDPRGAPRLSLGQKQNLAEVVHKSRAFQKDLSSRLDRLLSAMHALGTRKLYGFVDVAPSCGLRNMETAIRAKRRWKGKVDFCIGAYPVAGIGGRSDARYALLCKAAGMADFIGGLPEKDDAPGAFGSLSSMKALLELGVRLGKEVHVHVDQKNHPEERMTEMLVSAVKETGSPQPAGAKGPSVWAVHALSLSCYGRQRLQRLIKQLKRYNIGVVCCPNTISNLQLRSSSAPIHNCVAPVLELLAGGVQVRIGSDNIEDYCVPNGTPDLEKEIFYLAHLLRYYDADLFARLCCGVQPTKKQVAEIRDYLAGCKESMKKTEARLAYQNRKNSG